MMRIDDKTKFEYLLGRGILPSASDSDGFNALHYTVRLNKLEYLAFMLEGDYQAYEFEGDLNRL
jgi:hypothetical protein